MLDAHTIVDVGPVEEAPVKLTSAAFAHQGEIPQQYGMKVANISPPLEWTEVPLGTRSLALTMVDTHPVARGYVHWFVVGIDPGVTALSEGAAGKGLPSGRELEPYAGPFPPSGTHPYEITLYALDEEPSALPAEASVEAFRKSIQEHLLASATLTGRFTKRTLSQ